MERASRRTRTSCDGCVARGRGSPQPMQELFPRSASEGRDRIPPILYWVSSVSGNLPVRLMQTACLTQLHPPAFARVPVSPPATLGSYSQLSPITREVCAVGVTPLRLP